MTPEDEAFDELARRQGHLGGGFQAKRAAAADKLHWSDCAVHNEPAYPAGECDCGVTQEPVAWISPGGHIHFDPYLNSIPLYTTPPKREWIWLSDADIRETIDSICQYSGDYDEFLCKKIERKIKELNT